MLLFLQQKIKEGPVYLAFFLIVFISIVASSCSNEEQNVRLEQLFFSGDTMGTTYSIKAIVAPDNDVDMAALAADIEKLLQSYNDIMSTYIDDSELSRFNQAPVSQWVLLSDDLLDILDVSEKVSMVSGGAFDITLGPLINLWGFGPTTRSTPPSDDKINQVKADIGHHFIEIDIDNKRARRQKDVEVSLSAVAKGHATDVVARFLEINAIHNYMIEIGGELKIRGVNQRNTHWKIGIEKPALGRTGVVQAVTGDNIAIATSGEYRNYYEENGVRVSHTLNPVTGKPIQHKLASVTVVTEFGGYADAYATALNVLGPKQGYQLAQKEKLAAFFIVSEGDSFRVKYTDEFEKYMVQ